MHLPQRQRRRPTQLAAQKKQYGSFEELLEASTIPVLVDFYATWYARLCAETLKNFKRIDPISSNLCIASRCGPCQMLSPILGALSKRLEGKIQVVKIDSDKYGTVASKFNVQVSGAQGCGARVIPTSLNPLEALPTLILFKGGKPVDRIEGMTTESQLFDRLSYHL